MKKAFIQSSKMVEGLGEEAHFCGSAAVCGLLWTEEKTDKGRKLVVGNIGDCRAYVW